MIRSPFQPVPPPAVLLAGTASAEITPQIPVHLYGYPKSPRLATSINDPLTVQVMFIRTLTQSVLVVSVDWVCVPAGLGDCVSAILAVPVLIGATHTHSGPSVVDSVLDREDPHVAPADPVYLDHCKCVIIAACRRAIASARPAEVAAATGSTAPLGGHRHDPARTIDRRLYVLAVRAVPTNAHGGGGEIIGLVVVCAMHPTVLHEDFLGVSADFPGMARPLVAAALGAGIAVVHWAGACGDLSPRHAISANTLYEARRLAHAYSDEIIRAVRSIPTSCWLPSTSLAFATGTFDLPLRHIPTEDHANHLIDTAIQTLKVESSSPDCPDASDHRARRRTAECNLFGASNLAVLARAHRDGAIPAFSPARVSVLRIAGTEFVCLPGEWLAGHAEGFSVADRTTVVATLIGGETQGYIATPEALESGWYEASSALFDGPSTARLAQLEVRRLRTLLPPEAP